MSVSVSLTGSIKASDSVSGTIALSKVLTALSTIATSFSEAQSLSIGTSPTSVTLPISPCTFAYIKNLHATQTVTVTWTPNGGASNVVLTLQPGAYISFGETVQALSGITALSVQASGASTPIEYVLGG
jgi:hypothetical protein